MTLLLVVIAFLFLGLLQGSVLLRQRHWRDLVVFSAVWGIALALSLLIAFEVPLPRIFVLLNRLARRITGGGPP